MTIFPLLESGGNDRYARGATSVPTVAEPVRELAQGDHADEDEADDQHRLDHLLALFGGGRGEWNEHSERRHRGATLPHAAPVGSQRPLGRLEAVGRPG